jgi:hypothetical protein
LNPDRPTLDYQKPPRRLAELSASARYGLGVLSGLAISLAYYFLLAGVGGNRSVAELFGAIAFKCILGVCLLFVDRWRAFGLGLITSVPIAVLIFIGLCFGILAL